MSLRVYDYLKTQLNDAFVKAFSSSTNSPHIPVLFTTISPDFTTDIATPFPLKISQSLSIPVSTVSARLVEYFHFDENYISNTSTDIYCKGFFNFRLSTLFLLRSVYEAAITDPNAADLANSDQPILKKIRTLLNNNVPGESPVIEHFVTMFNRYGDHERKALRLIGISNRDAVHSKGAGIYFRKRLIAEGQNFYRKCPLRTPDLHLNLLRFFIVKALYNRIMMLNMIL